MELLEEYYQKVAGHKNSKGELAPHTIRDEKTDEILFSFKTKKEALDQLENIRKIKHIPPEKRKNKMVVESLIINTEEEIIIKD